MAFLALPSAAVLVVWVTGFDNFKAALANENPIALFFDPDSKKRFFLNVATRTLFVTNSFDLSHAGTV